MKKLYKNADIASLDLIRERLEQISLTAVPSTSNWFPHTSRALLRSVLWLTLEDPQMLKKLTILIQ